MIYNFDEIIDRSGNHSAKYDERMKKFGTNDVIPLWIADMKKKYDTFWTNMDVHRNNAFSLTAMEAAFTHGEEWLEQLLPYISANFDYVVDYLNKNIPQIKTYAPDATYLMWLDCRQLGMDDEALNRFFIEKAKLGLNAGNSFGRQLSGFMRLNAACPRSVLETAMAQLKAAVDAL